MFYSNIYKKYFPILKNEDLNNLTEKELDSLYKWICTIDNEIYNLNHSNLLEAVKKGTYRMYVVEYDYERDKDFLLKNLMKKNFKAINDEDLSFINNVIYRHKYNFFLSMYQFPILDGRKYVENLFQEEKEFLSEEEFRLLIDAELNNYSRFYRTMKFI